MSSPHLTYVPRSDARSEAELDKLADILKFILIESSASKKAAEASGGEDARKEDPNASGNVSISR